MQDLKIATFIEVAQNLSFTKAAQNLCLTQPAVSQQIRALEAEYGCSLFTRCGKSIALTEAGKLLLSASLTMRSDEERLIAQMQGVSKRRQIKFGATLTVSEFILKDALPEFIRRHSADKIEIQVANTNKLLGMIDSAELDFCIVEGEFSRTDYDYHLFSVEEYVCAASPKKAAELEGKKICEILDNTLLVREKGSGTRAILDATLKLQGLSCSQFANMVEVANISIIKSLVQADLGITFIYKAAIQEEIRQGAIRQCMIKGFPLQHDIAFIYRKGSLFKNEYVELKEEIYTIWNNLERS